MEEELNENELEERLYAMIHHVDQTQNNLIDSHQNNTITQLAENGPRGTLRRYWRTGAETNPYQKINNTRDAAVAKTIKEPAVSSVTKTTKDVTISAVNKNAKDPSVPAVTKDTPLPDDATLKEERSPPKPPSSVDFSIFQSPVPQIVKKTIEFLDDEVNNPVVLESSDEDEVVEVALPPKPTITIESSDEDELLIVKQNSPLRTESKSNSGERAVSASPVPSVVSSVSDEFIRGDCIALNISSRHPDSHSFDFSLHGSDLLGQTNASSKKKKRKRNKEATTSTPIVNEKPDNVADSCFATPKSKAKNKKQRNKLLTEKSIPIPDVYDSDSNQSTVVNSNKNPYIVTEKSLPSVDVYESDSNQSEIVREINTDQSKDKQVAYSSDSTVSDERPEENATKNISASDANKTIDLTENDSYITVDNTGMCDSIVIANVTGFAESTDYGDDNTSQKKDISKYVSSKVPSILYENLDFDNLKGNGKVCKRRRYSLTTLRAEMEKFYNESWGGEEFNHKEIQKNMSRDKSLWAIDPKDRMQSMAHRKQRCSYCNRYGHRDDTCHQKPPVCHMCGTQGHYEPRCPSKICVNCGSPNFMYSTMCRKCNTWPRVECAECGQRGHPASHCPDLWRRYHNTISAESPLVECATWKKPPQQYCSGCARRGHLLHACRVTLPFSGLPVYSPHVRLYRALYHPAPHPAPPAPPAPGRSKSFSEGVTGRNPKRVSKSPLHETHPNKKRFSVPPFDETEPKSSQRTKEDPKNKNKSTNRGSDRAPPAERPDSLASSNRDHEGRVIQDNEVSDTSAAVSCARVCAPPGLLARLAGAAGAAWLRDAGRRLGVAVAAPAGSFLAVSGTLAAQEAFQLELRAYARSDGDGPAAPAPAPAPDVENRESNPQLMVPKSRESLLRYIDSALGMLSRNLGDPKTLLKKLKYSRNEHEKLCRQKVISPTRLSNSRTHINTTLRKLNVILLGQTGLGGGARHLGRLVAFRRRLAASADKSVAVSLRKEIAEHYDCIFSAKARDDYEELTQKYYLCGPVAHLSRRQRKTRALAAADAVTGAAGSPPDGGERLEPAAPPVPPKQSDKSNGENAKCLEELVSFTSRLKSLRNSGACPNKAKTEMLQLMRRLHPCIAMLHRNKQMNSKQSKKVKKVQQHAQRFLANM